jgi:hypothetical protein
MAQQTYKKEAQKQIENMEKYIKLLDERLNVLIEQNNMKKEIIKMLNEKKKWIGDNIEIGKVSENRILIENQVIDAREKLTANDIEITDLRLERANKQKSIDRAKEHIKNTQA